MSHYKEVCKCGKVIMQCRCPGPKEIRVTDRCEHNWVAELEKELYEQYGIAIGVGGNSYRKYVEVELPATRHTLEVELTNVYGFVITLMIADETGGLLKEIDLYSCVKREDLADTIHSLYNSYE